MSPPGAPPILYEDPPYPSEGQQWVRGDVSPPVLRVYVDGRIYEQPYALPGDQPELVPPASGGKPAGGATPPPAIGTQTVFGIGVSEDDQFARRQSNAGVWPPDGPVGWGATTQTVVTQRYHAGTTYQLDNGLLRWNTAELAGKTIHNAALRVRITSSIYTVDGMNFAGEYQAWDGVSASDWSATYSDSAFEIPILSLAQSDFDIPLTDPDANINKAGYTHLRLHLGPGTPTGYNVVVFSAYANTYYEPARLVVTHS